MSSSPKRFRRAAQVALTTMVAALWVLGALASPAEASGPTILGAGSTWAAIALGQWQVDAAKQGLSINYQAVGSTAGRQLYIIKQVDFAATEIPFLPAEINQLKAEGRTYQYLPDVAGGTALFLLWYFLLVGHQERPTATATE